MIFFTHAVGSRRPTINKCIKDTLAVGVVGDKRSRQVSPSQPNWWKTLRNGGIDEEGPLSVCLMLFLTCPSASLGP